MMDSEITARLKEKADSSKSDQNKDLYREAAARIEATSVPEPWYKSERTMVSLAMIVAAVLLSLYGGLDVDNAWGGIAAFLAGMGFGGLRPSG